MCISSPIVHLLELMDFSVCSFVLSYILLKLIYIRITQLTLRRLAYPIEQLVDARTFECHEIVQQELSAAVQNEAWPKVQDETSNVVSKNCCEDL